MQLCCRTDPAVFNLAIELLALAEESMQIYGRLVQDDIFMLIEKEDGQYYLLAGAVLLGRFRHLSGKFGSRLSEIHTSGNVPQFKENLEKSMLKVFKRLQPEMDWSRKS